MVDLLLLSRRVTLGLLVVLGPVRAGAETAPPAAVADAVLAVSCDTFLSSLGVNTHVDQGYDPEFYVQPLRYLGVRNIRHSERNLSGLLMLVVMSLAIPRLRTAWPRPATPVAGLPATR